MIGPFSGLEASRVLTISSLRPVLLAKAFIVKPERHTALVAQRQTNSNVIRLAKWIFWRAGGLLDVWPLSDHGCHKSPDRMYKCREIRAVIYCGSWVQLGTLAPVSNLIAHLNLYSLIFCCACFCYLSSPEFSCQWISSASSGTQLRLCSSWPRWSTMPRAHVTSSKDCTLISGVWKQLSNSVRVL